METQESGMSINKCVIVVRLSTLVFALTSILVSNLSSAQGTYPNKPVVVVVPFAVGGGGDTLARTELPKVAAILGQPIIIDNRPGAGGNIGAEYVSHATPNGYTLLYGTSGTHGSNKALYKTLPFDPEKSFEPVARMTQIAGLLVLHSSIPANTTEELIAYLKKNPGKVNFASAGNGTFSHLAGELFKDAAKVDIVHIPYRGGGPAMNDVLSGRTPMMIDVLPSLRGHVAAGSLRPLGVTVAQRVSALPNVRTLIEAGLTGFDISAWDAIFAPAGTPKAIVDRLNACINQALADPKLKESLLARGAETFPAKPEELAQFIRSEAPKWERAVVRSGATVD